MANSYSGQFHQLYIGNNAGTLTEVSQYLTGTATVNLGAADRDATAFATGGVAIAERHERGALTCTVTCKFHYHPTLAKIIRQIVGSKSGFPVKALSGSNAAPTVGDEVFYGTMTLLEYTLSGLQPGQRVGIDCTFVPADGGSVRPAVTVY